MCSALPDQTGLRNELVRAVTEAETKKAQKLLNTLLDQTRTSGRELCIQNACRLYLFLKFFISEPPCELPLANRFGAGFDGLSSLLKPENTLEFSPRFSVSLSQDRRNEFSPSSLLVLSKLRQERTFRAFLKLLKNQGI